MRFAYADPPYLGRARYYDHPDRHRYNTAPAHVELMAELEAEFDGWALSCSAPSLAALLPAAPAGTRVAAWVKPFAAFKDRRVEYAWEPVLWHRTAPDRPGDPRGRDWLSAPITLRRGFTGAKPDAFAAWLAVLLGWRPGDELTDLFPGSGAIGAWFARPRLELDPPPELAPALALEADR